MRRLALLLALGLTSCEEPAPTTKVLSKTDLTNYTSVYLIEVGGEKFVVANGRDKLAICKH